MGRLPSCVCGECPKCVHRTRVYEEYQLLSPEERKARVARRDPAKVKAADRARYYRDKEKRRAAMTAYAKENPERVAAHKRAWAKRNPEKRAAQIAVGNAVRDGKLVKQPCEICGEKRVHGHHDDYAKPLEVIWLCPQHHADERKR